MIKVLSNEQMRQMDEHTINILDVPGIILMENAGRHSYEYISQFLVNHNLKGTIILFCGKGNNGGDGYVIARHLFNNGYDAHIYAIGDPQELKGDAKINYQICKNYKIPLTVITSSDHLPQKDSPVLIIDALLGTGLKGNAIGLMEDVINHINLLSVPVISIDIPSGLNGNSPAIPGSTITADLTITMALPKRAHLFYPAKKRVGKLEIADISMPVYLKEDPELNLNLVEYSDLSFPHLAEDDHKYTAGKLFVLAGSPGMTGAASLVANAALRTGVGLLNIGIPKSLNHILEVKVTEGLTIPLPETNKGNVAESSLPQLEERIQWADAVIIGPGCGREEETLLVLNKCIDFCLSQNKPVLIDADALFALASDSELALKLSEKVVLTPHHGEFLRLTSFKKSDLQNQPWQCLNMYLTNKNFVLNLKGAPSMVGTPDGKIFINPTGNPGLAKGGSGDVLAGIIGGLMARGLDPATSAITGNFIHGEAADILLDIYGTTSLLPSDLIEILPELLDLS